jgi:uncharacterized protein (TIGR02145 family)
MKGKFKNILQKAAHFLKNPKLIEEAFLLFFQKTKKFLKRLPKLTQEYFFLMFMSAENNHKRFQRKNIKNIPEIKEIREYQKDFRKKSFKISATTLALLVIIIAFPFIFKNRFAHSKAYAWIQSSWAGGATSNTANATNNLTNWTQYSNSPAPTSDITANSSAVTLTNEPATSAGETGGTYSGSLTNGSGMYPSTTAGGAYVAGGNILSLKKPQGATCISTAECASPATCINLSGTYTCCNDVCCGVAPSANGINYGTVVGEDGKCWLDRNLGATAVASAYNTQAAYGWLYQWGRSSDGHQYTAWGGQPSPALSSTVANTTSGLAFTGDSNPVTGSVSVNSPYTANFILNTNGAQNYDWLGTQITGTPTNLWDGAMYNNPCPTGFHVATQGEWGTLVSAAGITNYTTAASSKLHLPAAGFRNYDGTLYLQGSYGDYWSSSPYSSNVYHLYFSLGGVSPAYSSARVYGFSVRCLKN